MQPTYRRVNPRSIASTGPACPTPGGRGVATRDGQRRWVAASEDDDGIPMSAREPAEATTLFERYFADSDLTALMSLYEGNAVFPTSHGASTGHDQIRVTCQVPTLLGHPRGRTASSERSIRRPAPPPHEVPDRASDGGPAVANLTLLDVVLPYVFRSENLGPSYLRQPHVGAPILRLECDWCFRSAGRLPRGRCCADPPAAASPRRHLSSGLSRARTSGAPRR
jgi:hypothetical protein